MKCFTILIVSKSLFRFMKKQKINIPLSQKINRTGLLFSFQRNSKSRIDNMIMLKSFFYNKKLILLFYFGLTDLF